jgi:hypothetical protein
MSSYLYDKFIPVRQISPQNRIFYQRVKTRNSDLIEVVHEDVSVSYKNPADESITIRRKVEIIVIDTKKIMSSGGRMTGSRKELGCEWIEGEEMQQLAIEYLSETHIKNAMEQCVDVIAIFATPMGKNATMHALTLQWLVNPLPSMTDTKSKELFQFFFGLLSQAKGKMEIGCIGGSNGMAHASKVFLQMLHLPGITPRKSGVIWFPLKTKWVYLYINPYHQVCKLCCRSYAQPPLPGGQAHISKGGCILSPRCSKIFKMILKDFLMVKAESAPLVDNLNNVCL